MTGKDVAAAWAVEFDLPYNRKDAKAHQRLAKMIDMALVAAREAEREACAVVAEHAVPHHTGCGGRIARLIRTRSENPT